MQQQRQASRHAENMTDRLFSPGLPPAQPNTSVRHRTAAAEHLNTATKRLPDPAPPRRPRQHHPSRPSHPAPNPPEQTTAKRGHPRTDNPEARTAGQQVELITAHRARGTSLGATTACNQPATSLTNKQPLATNPSEDPACRGRISTLDARRLRQNTSLASPHITHPTSPRPQTSPTPPSSRTEPPHDRPPSPDPTTPPRWHHASLGR